MYSQEQVEGRIYQNNTYAGLQGQNFLIDSHCMVENFLKQTQDSKMFLELIKYLIEIIFNKAQNSKEWIIDELSYSEQQPNEANLLEKIVNCMKQQQNILLNQDREEKEVMLKIKDGIDPFIKIINIIKNLCENIINDQQLLTSQSEQYLTQQDDFQYKYNTFELSNLNNGNPTPNDFFENQQYNNNNLHQSYYLEQEQNNNNNQNNYNQAEKQQSQIEQQKIQVEKTFIKKDLKQISNQNQQNLLVNSQQSQICAQNNYDNNNYRDYSSIQFKIPILSSSTGIDLSCYNDVSQNKGVTNSVVSGVIEPNGNSNISQNSNNNIGLNQNNQHSTSNNSGLITQSQSIDKSYNNEINQSTTCQAIDQNNYNNNILKSQSYNPQYNQINQQNLMTGQNQFMEQNTNYNASPSFSNDSYQVGQNFEYQKNNTQQSLINNISQTSQNSKIYPQIITQNSLILTDNIRLVQQSNLHGLTVCQNHYPQNNNQNDGFNSQHQNDCLLPNLPDEQMQIEEKYQPEVLNQESQQQDQNQSKKGNYSKRKFQHLYQWYYNWLKDQLITCNKVDQNAKMIINELIQKQKKEEQETYLVYLKELIEICQELKITHIKILEKPQSIEHLEQYIKNVLQIIKPKLKEKDYKLKEFKSKVLNFYKSIYLINKS
ncbi:hypothetical protein ABPG74_021248 [Tetrahymena malaccensis]